MPRFRDVVLQGVRGEVTESLGTLFRSHTPASPPYLPPAPQAPWAGAERGQMSTSRGSKKLLYVIPPFDFVTEKMALSGEW